MAASKHLPALTNDLRKSVGLIASDPQKGINNTVSALAKFWRNVLNELPLSK